MSLPEGFLEEIKFRNDINDVISSYVTLKRAGANMVGLCPFHNEKSPSFTVFTSTHHFYCFGCGAGGDVITFIMKAENLDYMSALAFLAKRAGMTMPETGKSTVPEIKKDRFYQMNRDAARFYRDMLGCAEGAAGLAYLRGRGLSDAIIRHFGLGFAPDEFGLGKSMFLPHMTQLGYTEKELLDGFLCARSQKNGKLYPIFRNRVMFPILDLMGNVVAFGGRVMDDSKPKYLNSSDTPAFQKHRTLFALNFARKSCAERIILCEGYMDVISLHAAGFPEAVASCGTALTSDQVRMLARYTKQVVIAYDMDAAGRKAAEKAISMFDAVGTETKVLSIDGAKDPDEFIKKFGADAFRLRLTDSENPFDFRCNAILNAHDLHDLNDRIAAIEELTEVLAALPSEVVRDVYIERMAKRLELSPESLRADVRRAGRKREKTAEKAAFTNVIRTTAGYGDTVNPERAGNLRAARAEESILGILLSYPEQHGDAKKYGLCEDLFLTAFNRRVYSFFAAALEEHGTFDTGYLGEQFSGDEIGRIQGMLVGRSRLTLNNEAVLSELISVLKEEKQKNGQTAATVDGLEAMRRQIREKQHKNT